MLELHTFEQNRPFIPFWKAGNEEEVEAGLWYVVEIIKSGNNSNLATVAEPA